MSNQQDRSPADLLRYPQFDERQIVFRWRKEWWDGPIDGSILYNGKRYWFYFYCDKEEPGNPFFYLVYPLTDIEADFADSWSAENEQFRKEWCPLANNPEAKESPELKQLTEKWKEHELRLPDYTKREAVAWFAGGANASFYAVQIHRA